MSGSKLFEADPIYDKRRWSEIRNFGFRFRTSMKFRICSNSQIGMFLHYLYMQAAGSRENFTTTCDNLPIWCSVKAGEVFGLLGHNGAGKTTTMRIIVAEEAPTAGRIRIGSRDILSNQSEAFQVNRQRIRVLKTGTYLLFNKGNGWHRRAGKICGRLQIFFTNFVQVVAFFFNVLGTVQSPYRKDRLPRAYFCCH